MMEAARVCQPGFGQGPSETLPDQEAKDRKVKTFARDEAKRLIARACASVLHVLDILGTHRPTGSSGNGLS